MDTLSTFRLHFLRVFYLVLVVGLGMEMWPALIHGNAATRTARNHPAPHIGIHAVIMFPPPGIDRVSMA